MIALCGTIFAHVGEIASSMLVRRLAGFYVVVDIKAFEDDGNTITLGAERLLELVR